MVKLGVNITGFTMVDFLGRSADRVAVGYRSSAKALGYYQKTLFVYENVLDMLVPPLHVVAVAGRSMEVPPYAVNEQESRQGAHGRIRNMLTNKAATGGTGHQPTSLDCAKLRNWR
jgi:hypothetical protein